jgi:transmembrane protein TMEM43
MSKESVASAIAGSCIGRFCALFLGMPVGWVLSIAAVVVLFSNEGRAVKTDRALREGMAKVVSITADQVNPANAGKLVHVQGLVSTEETLHDPLFGVSTRALRLRRLVETYQWRQRSERHQQQTASGQRKTVTTYRYDRTWSAQLIDSSHFQEPFGHENPKSLPPFPSHDWEAKHFRLGQFTLPAGLREQLRSFAPLGIRVGEPPPSARQAGFRALDASFYQGADPRWPQIGDVRIVYESVPPTDVSIIAAQDGNVLGAYRTESGGKLEMLEPGRQSAAEIFREAHFWNRVKTWLYRVGGFFALLIGYRLALGPLTALANLLPGLLAGLTLATGFLAFLLAVAVTLVTTSIAWVAYRPNIGLPMLTAGVLLAILIGWWCRREREPGSSTG